MLNQDRLLTCVRIGCDDPTGSFDAVCRAVTEDGPFILSTSHRTIAETLLAGLGTTLIPDLVLVWQSYSDEYTAADVQQLIGLSPQTRIACCYGPWCVSDGRTHDIWPVACRMPVESAGVILHAEFLSRGPRVPGSARLEWSPLSAAEEVFAMQSLAIESATASGNSRDETIAILSSDRVLRRTISELCIAAGWHAQAHASPNEAESIRKLVAIIVDLDEEWLIGVAVSATTTLIGVTGFALHSRIAAVERRVASTRVVPKAELGVMLPTLLQSFPLA